MKEGYGRIFKGLFFATFHINAGAITILPSFFGWFIIVSGVKSIIDEVDNRSFKKAYFYAIITAVITVVTQLLTWYGYQITVLQYISLVYAIFSLLFIFYLLEGSIEYLDLHELKSAANHYRTVQRVYIIVYILNTILACVGSTIISNGLITLASIIGIGLVLSLMIQVRNLKNMEIEKSGGENIDISI